jgi:hypothetical protein
MSVALFIQQGKSKRHIIVPCASCQTLSYFSTQPNKRHGFRENVIKHNMYGLSFSTILSEAFPTLRRIERDMIKKYSGLHGKCPLFVSDFNET